MKLAIASGKGGTGKSTISVNLAHLLAKKYNNIALLDCDIEEPNCHLFLKPKFNYSEKVNISIPKINSDKCNSCGKCVSLCEFNAMAKVKDNILIFNELCHGCNSCKINCPQNAILEDYREIGTIEAQLNEKISFIQGKTRVGEAMSPPLIKKVKSFADLKNFNIEIIDSPPGTSCPFINTIYGVDYVVMVTEPTPFGLYDLKLAVDVVKKIKIPFGIVINKSNDNDLLIESWIKENNIEIITKIPEDINIAKNYSNGEILLEKNPELEKYFTPFFNLISEVKNG